MLNQEPLIDVRLILRGETLDPVHVTTLFGTGASDSRVKGATTHTSSGKDIIFKTGLWALNASSAGLSISDQLRWLKEQLASATVKPADIPGVQAVEISVFVALGSNDRGGGDFEFQLSPQELTWLSNLGVPISFAFAYVPTDPGNEAL